MSKKTDSKPQTPKSNLVNFRLPPSLLKQLDELALRSEESRGEYAKRLVIEAMTQSWRDDLDERLRATDERVDRLREDLATTVLAMLVTFAEQDPAKAKRWVHEHFFKSGDDQ